ncbi:hypothetical protein R6Q57_021390 [Mikania cordata]
MSAVVRTLNWRSKNVYKDPDDGRQRFLLELEFVQYLANPTCVHYSAQNRYLKDEAFIGYLSIHIVSTFWNLFKMQVSAMLWHIQPIRNNRLKHILPRPLPEPTAAPLSNALPPPMATTMAASSVPVSAPPVPSPMQYGVPSGQPLAKNDPRNAIDRRESKTFLYMLVKTDDNLRRG